MAEASKRLTLIPIILSLAILLAITPKISAQPQEKILVLVTAPPLKSIIEEVGGEIVEARSLLPAGVDPHSYEPGSRELLDAIAGASLIVMTGPHHLPVEESIRRLEEEGFIRIPVLDYRDYQEAGLILLKIPGTNISNPHGYLYSIMGIKAIAKASALELSRISPEYSSYFEERLRGYLEELDSIKAKIKAMEVGEIKVILGGPDLQYLAEDLGLRVEGFILKAHGAEPSLGDIMIAIDAVRKGRASLILLSDLELMENPELTRILDEQDIPYLVIPLIELADKPELSPVLAAALLKSSVERNMESASAASTSVLELIAVPSLLANLILLLFLILLVMKVRRYG